MGKKGQALREAKRRTSTYTFTREQLEAHDKAVIEDFRARFERSLQEHCNAEMDRCNAELDAEIRRREEEFGGYEGVFNMLCYTISVPVQVLVREFGWKPLPKDRRHHPNARLARFVERVADIMTDIENCGNLSVTDLCRETYEKYGVMLERTEAEEP